MARLEDLKKGEAVEGIHSGSIVTIIDVKWHGPDIVKVTFEDDTGQIHNELIFRDREPTLRIKAQQPPFRFDGDGELFRLVSEARRIRLAHLFDRHLAVHTSLIEPLPHQITGVYETMLPRQPLRFLLADDPGAGKTIMAGLLIKELMARGDLHRCLICCPGNLAEQWQDELDTKFHMQFDIVDGATIKASRARNPFTDKNLIIGRLDVMSRNKKAMALLDQTDWDLVVVDEAHKMHASFFGREIKETKRYKLGRLLGRRTRHFLLLTATPHNGKEEEFQLFLALLDPDRFEGAFRNGTQVEDVSDLMRRVTKENLVRLDGTPLFPERRAYTVTYTLSEREARLYQAVTEYVRKEMNRAELLTAEGEGRRGNLIGFALTILQRRLASSPKAIYQSLRRRRRRLQTRLAEQEAAPHDSTGMPNKQQELDVLLNGALEDLDDVPSAEIEAAEQHLVEQTSAARTISELESEIDSLMHLEQLAREVLDSHTDRKWEELSDLLRESAEMFDSGGNRRKLIIFSEHRDTVSYLADRLADFLDRPEAVLTIHGGMDRDERYRTQERFSQDRNAQILVATDAAGEGINLQRAHLMVNYDLPWNPNRIEQRFGRIHRIGQTEVCHLWNLVAYETREGRVYRRLLDKIDEQRKALGGRVFDVLGKLFRERSLRDLLVEAIRNGEEPEVHNRLLREVDSALERERIQRLLEERSLVQETLDTATIRRVKEDVDRADTGKLQPYFVASFFLKAFRLLGGKITEREPNRYEILKVPYNIRGDKQHAGVGRPVLRRYERVTFHKDLIHVPARPPAQFICPGHPLLDATIAVLLDKDPDLLRRGAVLVDPRETGADRIRMLFYVEHTIQDQRVVGHGHRRTASRQLQFVEMDAGGSATLAGPAPYLDYRPIRDDERQLVAAALTDAGHWKNPQEAAVSHAIQHLVPKHTRAVRCFREEVVSRTKKAVESRLRKEIDYWYRRARELAARESAGRANVNLNSAMARTRAERLENRLNERLEELEQERRLSVKPPVVVGGALVVPMALIRRMRNVQQGGALHPDKSPEHRQRLALQTVLETERRLGRPPTDVTAENLGHHVESRQPDTGRLLFVCVKAYGPDDGSVVLTRNEVLTLLNRPKQAVLALVEVSGDTTKQPVYIKAPFNKAPDFDVATKTYKVTELVQHGGPPS